MARRRKVSGLAAIPLLLALGAVGWIIKTIGEIGQALTPEGIAVCGVLLIALIVMIYIMRALHRRAIHHEGVAAAAAAAERYAESLRARRATLLAKYGNEQVVDHIMQGDIWHDMTKEQLLDSWGIPAAKEQTVLKTKVREVFKYEKFGVNRFGRRAFLENDRVAGWEKK